MWSLEDNDLFVPRRTTLITQLRFRLFSLCLGAYYKFRFLSHFFLHYEIQFASTLILEAPSTVSYTDVAHILCFKIKLLYLFGNLQFTWIFHQFQDQ